MAYLSNAAINRLNVHSSLHGLAWNLSGSFFVVLLLSRGFSAAEIFFFLAAVFATRFVSRPVVLFLTPRIGSRLTLFVGTALFALQYLLLARVRAFDALFGAYWLVCALTDVFYWTSYHAIFAFSGDREHRGKQISAREAAGTAAAIAAPLLGGLAVDRFGPNAVFAVAAAIELLAILPIWRIPDLPVAESRPAGTFEAVKQGAVLFMADGWINVGSAALWAVVLFGVTGPHFAEYGGLLTAAGIASALGGLWLGRAIDAGRLRHVGLLNGGLLIGALTLKAFAADNLLAVAVVTAASSMLAATYTTVLMTAVYSYAGKAPCPLRFVFLTESAWDVGCASASLIAGALLASGIAPGWAILIAVPGAIVEAIVLDRFYGDRFRFDAMPRVSALEAAIARDEREWRR
jgi:MFS transporter, DHA1 family, inner membrane transport protein